MPNKYNKRNKQKNAKTGGIKLTNLRYGLVLAGGGGKGAYQIGVLKALASLGFDVRQFSAISGTSIGALNLALFVQNDLELAEQIWLSVTPDQIFSFNPHTIVTQYLRSIPLSQSARALLIKWAFSTAVHGVFSRSGLLGIIDRHIDLNLISRHSTGLLTAVCMEFPLPKVKYFQLNTFSPDRIKSILLASSAIPLIYNPVQIDGKFYVDGGIVDNVPILPIYRLGCDIIIVVHLSPSVLINQDDFAGAKIFEIVPSQSLGSFINGTLDFSLAGIRKRIDLGYQDGLRIADMVRSFAMVQVKSLSYLQTVKENLK